MIWRYGISLSCPEALFPNRQPSFASRRTPRKPILSSTTPSCGEDRAPEGVERTPQSDAQCNPSGPSCRIDLPSLSEALLLLVAAAARQSTPATTWSNAPPHLRRCRSRDVRDPHLRSWRRQDCRPACSPLRLLIPTYRDVAAVVVLAWCSCPPATATTSHRISFIVCLPVDVFLCLHLHPGRHLPCKRLSQ